MILLSTRYQDAFFGRTIGFQYCESLHKPLAGVASALVSYYNEFEAFLNEKKEHSQQVDSQISPESNKISPLQRQRSLSISFSEQNRFVVKSLFNSTKYLLDPELRANKVYIMPFYIQLI